MNVKNIQSSINSLTARPEVQSFLDKSRVALGTTTELTELTVKISMEGDSCTAKVVSAVLTTMQIGEDPTNVTLDQSDFETRLSAIRADIEKRTNLQKCIDRYNKFNSCGWVAYSMFYGIPQHVRDQPQKYFWDEAAIVRAASMLTSDPTEINEQAMAQLDQLFVKRQSDSAIESITNPSEKKVAKLACLAGGFTQSSGCKSLELAESTSSERAQALQELFRTEDGKLRAGYQQKRKRKPAASRTATAEAEDDTTSSVAPSQGGGQQRQTDLDQTSSTARGRSSHRDDSQRNRREQSQHKKKRDVSPRKGKYKKYKRSYRRDDSYSSYDSYDSEDRDRRRSPARNHGGGYRKQKRY